MYTNQFDQHPQMLRKNTFFRAEKNHEKISDKKRFSSTKLTKLTKLFKCEDVGAPRGFDQRLYSRGKDEKHRKVVSQNTKMSFHLPPVSYNHPLTLGNFKSNKLN